MRDDLNLLIPEKKVLTPAQLFFNFAFPAYGHCPGQPSGDYERLIGKYRNNDSPDMYELAKIFPVGIQSLKINSGNPYMCLEEITIEHVRDYILRGHNRMIDAGIIQNHRFKDKKVRERCKVKDFIIKSVEISYDRNENPPREIPLFRVHGSLYTEVYGFWTPDSQPGDKVFVHLGHTIRIE